jgi:Protein of unknown function (DUF2785)
VTFTTEASAAATLPGDLATLVNDLRSPDPAVRDSGAYTALAERIRSGRADDHLAVLGNTGAAMLGAGEIQSRTFGSLLVALVVDRVNELSSGGAELSGSTEAVRALDVVRWLAAFVTWYPAEGDLRGYDEMLGWLHAVAHGADTLGAFGGSPLLTAADLTVLLDLAVDRLHAPTLLHLTQSEDDRLALAVMSIVVRDSIPTDDLVAWVDRLATVWRTAPDGALSPQVDNTMRFARTLHLQLTLGVHTERGGVVRRPAARDELLRHLGAALSDGQWFLGSPT